MALVSVAVSTLARLRVAVTFSAIPALMRLAASLASGQSVSSPGLNEPLVPEMDFSSRIRMGSPVREVT